MKQAFLLPVIGVLLTKITVLSFAQVHFTATLNGGQVVPPLSTVATGSGSFELSGDLSELRYFVSYQGMIAGTAGLYAGARGANGTLLKALATPASVSGTISGTWMSGDASPLTRAVVDSLLSGRVYLELNAGNNTVNGGVRGQLDRSTSLHFEAVYEGNQVIPPVSTTAGGTGVFVLDKSGARLEYHATYRGLGGNESSGGEIRTGAAGTTGPVARMIGSPGGSPSATVQGAWTSSDDQPLTPALVDSLIAGKMYSSFSTAAHQGGEIRGQIVLKSGIGFLALLDSAGETPATSTHASCTGSFVMSDARDRVTYSLTYIGLSAPVAGGGHIHLGSTGETGGIVKTLVQDGAPPEGTVSGAWSAAALTENFSPALAESLLTGKLYADLHTSPGSGGEIRGQVGLTTGAGYTSQLSARQDVPPTVISNGTGVASVVLSPDRQSIAYNLTYHDVSGDISTSGGHFHTGARGVNGVLVRVIVPPNAPGNNSVAGVWTTSEGGAQPLTSALVDSLVAGHIYINLHTGAYIGGEIRGQVFRDLDVLTSVPEMSPVPPVEFLLEQNYPNPFNPATTIRFRLPRASRVDLAIYNALGQHVATLIRGEKPAGAYSVRFSGSGLSSGVYFCRLQAGDLVQTRKLIIEK